MEVVNAFAGQAVYRLDESFGMISKCFNQLSEEEVWKRPNASSNSIGTLIVHLCGNITQYIISSLGDAEDKRNRDSEFATHGGYTKAALLSKLETTLQQAKAVIQQTGSERLVKMHSVQGFNLPGIGIVIHVVEHFSYHTGQIALLTKLFINKDLGFYDGVDLNVKNEI